MRFDWWTVALQTINFVVLVWLLHRLLYRPVLRLIDARRAEVGKLYADAAAEGEAAKAERARLQVERAGMAAERDRILRETSAQAEATAADRRAEAEKEAAAMVAAARKTIDGERGQALAEARRAAFDLGTDIARRLLAEVPPALRAEAWLERVEHHLAGLSEADRAELVRGPTNGATVTVAAAAPFPPATADAWRSRLRRILGDGTAVAFEVAPDLVAGVELHFASAILRFSWKSAVDDLRGKLAADGDAS